MTKKQCDNYKWYIENVWKQQFKEQSKNLKKASICKGCKYINACFDPDREQPCAGYESLKGGKKS